MIDRATATGWLKAVEGEELDEVLADKGFSRTGYGGKVKDGKQKIKLGLHVRPRYAPDSFHLVLNATMAYPKLAEVRAEMLADDPLAVGKDGTMHRPCWTASSRTRRWCCSRKRTGGSKERTRYRRAFAVAESREDSYLP
jgi:hypothetical protein